MTEKIIDAILDGMDDLHFLIAVTALALVVEFKIYIPIVAIAAYAAVVS